MGLSEETEGADCLTDVAGAILNNTISQLGHELGFHINNSIVQHGGYKALARLDELNVTGTNVNDLKLLPIG